MVENLISADLIGTYFVSCPQGCQLARERLSTRVHFHISPGPPPGMQSLNSNKFLCIEYIILFIPIRPLNGERATWTRNEAGHFLARGVPDGYARSHERGDP